MVRKSKSHRAEATAPLAVSVSSESLPPARLLRLPADVLGVVYSLLGTPASQAALRATCSVARAAFDLAVRNERFVAVAGSDDAAARWDAAGVRWYPVDMAGVETRADPLAGTAAWPSTLVVSCASPLTSHAIPEILLGGGDGMRFGRVQMLAPRAHIGGVFWGNRVASLEVVGPSDLPDATRDVDDEDDGDDEGTSASKRCAVTPRTAREYFTIEYFIAPGGMRVAMVFCVGTFEEAMSVLRREFKRIFPCGFLMGGGHLVLSRFVDLCTPDGDRVALVSTLDLLDRDPMLREGSAARHLTSFVVKRASWSRAAADRTAILRVIRAGGYELDKPVAQRVTGRTSQAALRAQLAEDCTDGEEVLSEMDLNFGDFQDPHYMTIEDDSIFQLDEAPVTQWGRECFAAEFKRYGITTDVTLRPAKEKMRVWVCDHYGCCGPQDATAVVGRVECRENDDLGTIEEYFATESW